MALAEAPTEKATQAPERLAEALSAWSQALGATHVQASADVCARYGRSTSPWQQQPVAVVRPATVAEIQQVVRIAGRYRCPLYPISGGKNWGLGDACPTTAGQTIVDLRRLNAIREVNEELCYAVIEAGVTQQQLYDFLQEHAPGLSFDATGAGPTATIVGNIMERGYGHSPYGDRYHHSCNYEVILGDGELLRTGFGRFENARCSHLLKAGLGPSLDGLFTQSNLGIVTAMTVWLMPKPEYFEAFAFKVADDAALPDIVDALRPLRLSGVLPSTVHIANDMRLVSSKMRYPWELTGGVTPLPGAVRQELQKEFGIGAWNVLGGLYGTRAVVSAARHALRQALRGIAKPKFVNDGKLALAARVVNFAQRFGFGKRLAKQLASIKPAYALLKGEPVADHLRGTAWRTRASASGSPMDPLERGDGLIWLSPTLPMTGHDAVRVESLARPIFESHGFDLLLTYVSINGRAMCSPMTICYDGANAREREQAAKCYGELAATMFTQGYHSYRLGVQSMEHVGEESDIHPQLIGRINKELDPEGILAPGRYGRSL